MGAPPWFTEAESSALFFLFLLLVLHFIEKLSCNLTGEVSPRSRSWWDVLVWDHLVVDQANVLQDLVGLVPRCDLHTWEHNRHSSAANSRCTKVFSRTECTCSLLDSVGI